MLGSEKSPCGTINAALKAPELKNLCNVRVNYHKPVEIHGPIELRGWTTNREALASRKAWVECVLRVNGEDAAGASILFVRTTAE